MQELKAVNTARRCFNAIKKDALDRRGMGRVRKVKVGSGSGFSNWSVQATVYQGHIIQKISYSDLSINNHYLVVLEVAELKSVVKFSKCN